MHVKNKIIGEIISGNYPDGTFLPPEKTLMEQFNVARNTVRTALKELAKERIILKQQGRPSIIQRKYIENNSGNGPLKIAWLDMARAGLALPVHFEIFRSTATMVSQKNIQFNYISLPMLEKQYLDTLDFSGHAGVITNGTYTDPDILQVIKKIPDLICIDHLNNIPACNYICTNNRKGGYLAGSYLLERGCRNIVFLGITPTFYSYMPFSERLQGYLDALLEAGITPRQEQIIITCDQEAFQNVESFLASKLELLKTCDAIFAITDWIAIDTVFALQRMGFSVPGNISVIGFDGMAQAQFMHPRLTTIRQPVEKIAQKIIDSVLESYFQSGSPEHLIQIEPELLIGETVK